MPIGLQGYDPIHRLSRNVEETFYRWHDFHKDSMEEHPQTPVEAFSSVFGFGLPSFWKIGQEFYDEDPGGVYAKTIQGLMGVAGLVSLYRALHVYENFRYLLELKHAPWRGGWTPERMKWRDFRYGVSLLVSRITMIVLIPMFIYWDYESGQDDPDTYRRQDFDRRTL